jgi:hypothetical protein
MNSPGAGGNQGAQAFTNPGGLEGLRKFAGANTKPVGGGVFNSSAEAPGYTSSLPNGMPASHFAPRNPRVAMPPPGMFNQVNTAMGGYPGSQKPFGGGGFTPGAPLPKYADPFYPGVASINDGTAYRPGGRPPPHDMMPTKLGPRSTLPPGMFNQVNTAMGGSNGALGTVGGSVPPGVAGISTGHPYPPPSQVPMPVQPNIIQRELHPQRGGMIAPGQNYIERDRHPQRGGPIAPGQNYIQRDRYGGGR